MHHHRPGGDPTGRGAATIATITAAIMAATIIQPGMTTDTTGGTTAGTIAGTTGDMSAGTTTEACSGNAPGPSGPGA